MDNEREGEDKGYAMERKEKEGKYNGRKKKEKGKGRD